MRTIGIIIVLALWLLMGWKMCTDYGACCEDEKVAVVKEAVPAPIAKAECTAGVICFATSSCDAEYGNRFEAFKDSLISLVTGARKLRITGIYNATESYGGDSSNLGRCRAETIRRAFSGLSDDQVETSGQLSVGRVVGIGERVSFDIIEEVVDDEPAVNSQAVIYFPFNSTNKLNDSEIEGYLNQVADRVKNSGERIRLAGHTDDIGSASSNVRLGQRRANIIADYLMGRGVRRTQINATSKGETEPLATNSTEVGRARNRRTELQIIQ